MPKYRKFFATALSLSLYSTSFASINTEGFQVNAYAGLSDTRISPGSLQLSGETDTLNSSNTSLFDFTAGAGFAYRFLTPHSTTEKPRALHDISLGLDLFYLSTSQDGQVWQYNNPSLSNYSYQLPIPSWRLMTNSEFTFYPLAWDIYPFIEGGVGIARNTASYSDSPNAGVGGTGLNINSHTQYQFAYSAGAGVKIPLQENLLLSFRYLYTNLGKAQTAQSGNVNLQAPINNQLYTQSWLMGLSYLF